MEITSVNNELVKETVKLQQKKYRTQTNKFLLEGYKSIKEAHDSGIQLEYIFVEKTHSKDYNFFDNVIETNSIVLKKLSATDTPPPAVAVGIQKQYDKNLLKESQKVILLENIRDTGNLGAIIRSSAAFKADVLILYGESVDLYNPKCVRASVGNLWKIPVIQIKDFCELQKYFINFERIATMPKSKNLLRNFKVKLPCLLMFGSEADGLSDELINFSTSSVKIEMTKIVESLNLASSVSVILYQLFME